ncbi:MAG: Fic family protein [Acidobacteriia bacterium]|nr:Fic family protein [Terriglobia bacterium]
MASAYRISQPARNRRYLQHPAPPHSRFSCGVSERREDSGTDEEYGEWLSTAAPEPATSFDAHFKLVAIHPFTDGNGRTARLLMNLLLLRGGYPPVAVRPEDRKTYLDRLEHASMRENLKPFQTFMHQRLDATLGEYLSAFEEAQLPETRRDQPSGPEPKR